MEHAPDTLCGLFRVWSCGKRAPVGERGKVSAEEMRTRIQLLRLGGDGKQEPISRDDLHILREAMLTFAHLTRRLVPPSPERDETLKSIGRLRKHLETMLLP
jgi:hypothetical protein